MTTAEPVRALIVEDDPVVARSIARRMLREGYTVSMAQTCRAGRASGTGFQVAVLDLDLPDGSGAALADELLRLGSVRGVLFFTGSIDPGERARAAEYGPVFDKSGDLESLISALDPFPTVPPISHTAPAARKRSSSASRLTRRGSDKAGSVGSVAARSSRR